MRNNLYVCIIKLIFTNPLLYYQSSNLLRGNVSQCSGTRVIVVSSYSSCWYVQYGREDRLALHLRDFTPS